MNGRILAVRADITHIIGQKHVRASDAEIVEEFKERLRYAGANWTKREKRRIIALALAEHHRNQRLYADVMGGLL